LNEQTVGIKKFIIVEIWGGADTIPKMLEKSEII
jgi:hypothetical protein